MANIFIIHGTYGNPEGNWFPWLKEELEHLGQKVWIPRFPTPENQSLQNWIKVFDGYREYLNEETIVIGHNIGVAFLLDIIEELETPIKSAFFVSGFVGSLGNKKYDELNSSFIAPILDWTIIKSNCRKFVVFHSDNDPYVPLAKAEFVARRLGVNIKIIENGGHLNAEAGYTKFNELLEEVKKEL